MKVLLQLLKPPDCSSASASAAVSTDCGGSSCRMVFKAAKDSMTRMKFWKSKKKIMVVGGDGDNTRHWMKMTVRILGMGMMIIRTEMLMITLLLMLMEEEDVEGGG